MKCENIQFNLSVYYDDVLTASERAAIDAHLPACPLCRERLADFKLLRNDLRAFSRRAMTNDLLASMRTRVAEEIRITRREPNKIFSEAALRWLQMRLMPYGVATIVTLVFGFGLLWSLLAAANGGIQNREIARVESPAKSSVIIANNTSKSFTNPDLSAADYAAARIPISGDAPAINPKGALVALTKSLVRGKMKDDEVVVVADVFGNGLAQIAEVVEPSGDRRAVRELEEALENNPDFAPFLPSSADGRSETVRVVLKIQRVDVQTRVKSKRK